MNTIDNTACAATDEGRPCRRGTVMTTPVALCEPHRLEVALAVVPDLLRGHLVAATSEAAAPAPRMDLVEHAAGIAHDALLTGGTHEPVVYFIANGGRVKIGYTTNLRSRLSSLTLRADNVLLTLVGGPDLERALHARFTGHRQGNSEWFDLAPEVFRYVAGRSTATASAPADAPVMPSPTAAPAKRNLVTAKRAAELAGVHRATLDGWVRDGLLPIAAENEMGWRLYDADAVRSLARAASN